ncbi:response regulator transcription factor [Terriglobus sp. 2YAB30_2]|uniref:response regulator transcription factor n=1 Tax=unclassified Terriglobus TaxID=2628988 RepID=UPI003F9E3A53
MRILVVEDDPRMGPLLKDALEKKSYLPVLATSGSEGLEIASEHEFELIILDIMLPGLNGLEVARGLRARNIGTPVLMLTARDTITDVVDGLDCGVDDYMTKPFAFEELFARLRALARRQTRMPSVHYQIEDLKLDPVTHHASRSGTSIQLTRTEYLLLEYMMRRPNSVLRRDSIINAVWGYERTVENNTLDAFMKQLRSKIDDGFEVKLIHTVRGFGYRLASDKL